MKSPLPGDVQEKSRCALRDMVDMVNTGGRWMVGLIDLGGIF